MERDEAEYCERVGIMRDGKLPVMDTPSNLEKNIVKDIALGEPTLEDVFVSLAR